MIIYADILIMVNFIVDFFLIRTAAYFLKENISIKRNILAALVSSLFCFYIFLPKLNILISVLLKVIPAVIVALICNAHKNLKMLIRWSIYFFCSSFIYAGLMFALYTFLNPERLSVYNGVVYFNISPLILISLTLLFYILFKILSKISSISSPTAKRVDISLIINSNSLKATAMVDSGHTITDVFSNKIMIIIEKSTAKTLFGDRQVEDMLMLKTPFKDELKSKYRVVTVNTINGERLMPGIRLEKFILHKTEGDIELKEVVAIISNNDFNDNYSCIIPETIMN